MKKSRKRQKSKVGRIIQYKGEKIFGEHIIMCPKCNVQMGKRTDGRFIIDVCPNCKGIFLDKNEVDNIGKQGFMNYVLAYFKRPKKVER